jgi:hypothetical protein
MDKNSKRKQVHEDLHLIYMTSCREVKGREIVKEEIRIDVHGWHMVWYSVDVHG